jgi:hypothetical protein
MNNFLKWWLKTLFIGIFWVFFLSITINGRTLFSHAHGVFVDNAAVHFLDQELAELWDKVSETARVTFQQISEGERKI